MKKINIFFLAIFCFSGVMAQDTLTGPKVGSVAPEIKLPNPEGKEIALSSLRGKVVLIDFWASWCGPCRVENPYLVSAYNKYKETNFKAGKGFTVYSVSLDKGKDPWVNGIKQDNLSWPYHVSDLKWFYSSAAQLYQVQGIPTNWLIDADGVIVARNLRGPALEAALENLKGK